MGPEPAGSDGQPQGPGSDPGRHVLVGAGVLDAGPERDALWAAMLEDRAWYADYQAKTERVIPLVRLAETEAITD